MTELGLITQIGKGEGDLSRIIKAKNNSNSVAP